MFFQGVMERVLVELALPTPFPPLPSSPTTPQPLSYHPHKIRKSRKNRIAFSPATSLNLLYQQLALNSLRIQSPSTISTPISKFNFFDDISEHLFLLPFYFILMDPLPRLYSIALSFHFVVCLPKNHPFFISMAPFLLLSSFIYPLFIILLHIFTNLSSVLFVPAFSYYSLI